MGGSRVESKWIIITSVAVLVIVSILLLLYLLGRKSAHAEVLVEEAPEQVWTTLTDFNTITNWNDVLVPVEGELKENTTIKYEFSQDTNNTTAISASVKQIEPQKLIRQQGGVPLILTFEHQYQLVPVSGGTKVIIHEEYRGVMVPFWSPRPVEKAYERLLEALKVHLEDKL